MRVSWSWKNCSPTFHAARGTFISEVWQLSAEVWRLSSRGRGWTFRPRLAVRPRKWKCLLRHEKLGWRFSMSRTKLKIGPRILFFWGRGLDLRLDLSLWSELQHFKNSLKVSRSSTENSRPKACYFPKSEARGQNQPLRLPSYTTSIKKL